MIGQKKWKAQAIRMTLQTPDTLPISRHFQLIELAGGVYAALSQPGSGSMSNAGIIDLGDQTLIFDTFWTPQAAQDLRTAAEQLCERPVSYVINSHADGDHVHGNAVFAHTASIIATAATRQAIAQRDQAFIEWAKANFTAYLRAREQYVANEPNEERRMKLQLELTTQQELAQALPDFELALPDLTFEHTMTFHGSQRSVTLMALGAGHSESDSVLLLPDEKIAFMGDLFFVHTHPVIQRGDPRAWIAMLEQIERLELTQLISGHGLVGSLEHVTQTRQLLQEMLHLATEAVEGNYPAAEAAEISVPKAYADWSEADRFGSNMRFLHGFLAPQQLDPALLSRKE